MMERVGVVGLGRMGLAMATTLSRAGHAVVGHDVAPAARERALAAGVAVADGLGELALSAGVIVSSLPDDAAVTALVDGLIEAAPAADLLLIDTSTIEPETSRALAATLREAGHAMLDAPVSGGPAGAAAGTLTMMVGGEAADIERAAPVLDSLAGKIVHVGANGTGHAAKLVNNLLCATHLLAIGEALLLAEAAGAAPERVMAAVNAASGRSAVSEVNVPRWILSGAFDSGFTMGLMRKDVRLAGRLIDKAGLDAPLSHAAVALWAASAAALADGEDFNRVADPSAAKGERDGA